MKQILTLITIVVLSSVFSKTTSAQTSVTSTTGYTVNIAVQPKAIVVSSSSCQYGYNYNVKLDYNITFSGTNIPSSLYTLQGTLGCNSSASHFFDLPNNGGVGSVTSQSNVWNSNHDCATASVASLNCYTVNIQISGPGISNRTVSFTAANTPLPITLIDFNAQVERSDVKLDWSTATETNNDYFTIEKSLDGANWSVVTTVKGAVNSTSRKNYETVDNNPVNGTSYYRLKQTDIDGKFTYSDVKSVKFSGSTAVSIFPVPNAGNTLNFKGIGDAKNTTIIVRDAAGASVFSTTLTSVSVQLPSLKAGLYFISVNNKVTGETNNLQYVKI